MCCQIHRDRFVYAISALNNFKHLIDASYTITENKKNKKQLDLNKKKGSVRENK